MVYLHIWIAKLHKVLVLVVIFYFFQYQYMRFRKLASRTQELVLLIMWRHLGQEDYKLSYSPILLLLGQRCLVTWQSADEQVLYLNSRFCVHVCACHCSCSSSQRDYVSQDVMNASVCKSSCVRECVRTYLCTAVLSAPFCNSALTCVYIVNVHAIALRVGSGLEKWC